MQLQFLTVNETLILEIEHIFIASYCIIYVELEVCQRYVLKDYEKTKQCILNAVK